MTSDAHARWSAAIALQDRCARELDTLEGQAYCDAINSARHELFAAFRTLDEAEQASPGRQSEWTAAYNAVREAEIRAGVQYRSRQAIRQVERLRSDGAAALSRASELVQL